MNIKEPIARAEDLIDDMKKHAIDYILPMSGNDEGTTIFDIHKKFPDKFPGVIPFLNPELHKEPNIMEDWIKKGAVSVKLYPSQWKKFTLQSEVLLPYFKKMVELNINPIIHAGVVKGGDSTYWPVNPIKIKPWLIHKDLKDLKFVFAHFGAGYLREILMMAYANKKRILVDTSGSNDWIEWSPWDNLTQVFEKTIRALSSSNILFGTDSNIEMLREDVILRQKGILQDLVTRKVINQEDREKILFTNTVELFNIKL